MQQPKNSLQLPKTTQNTHKIAHIFMTVPSEAIHVHVNMQSTCKHDLSRSKVKAAMTVHFMADVIPFLAYLTSPLN